jgi:hypothetical protein
MPPESAHPTFEYRAARESNLLGGPFIRRRINQMNLDQLLGILRVVVPVGTGLLVSQGVIPAGTAADVTTAVLGVGAALWSYFAHTDSAKIAAVAALPDVKKIVTAAFPVNPAVKAAAEDSAQTKVAPTP